MPRQYLYQSIAASIADQIRSGSWKTGDRLPSVRDLCEHHGIGMNTAKRIYSELESWSLIEARPQSGYFVNRLPLSRLPLATTSKPSPAAQNREPADLISKVYHYMGREDLTMFSMGVPAETLLPVARLNKELVKASRVLKGSGTGYETLAGNTSLRKIVAARAAIWGGNLHEDELMTTSGGMNAVSFCMMALSKPGDTIAIESPCYPGILQLARSLRLKVLELPTHPETGIDLLVLQRHIAKIDLCLLIPNFNTPLGSCMPDENKEAVVRILARHNIPLIEDDIYGDLFFGSTRPHCCKAFDKKGMVLLCSAVSKTLAPGYRVGWVAAGRYMDQIMKLKLVHALSTPAITHQAIATYMSEGRYDRHLRQLRRNLKYNRDTYAEIIADHFPEGTKTSRPQGGLALWVEFDKRINTAELFDKAVRNKITFSPGRMFSLQNQFNNCMRISLGLPWSEEVGRKLSLIGKLAKGLI